MAQLVRAVAALPEVLISIPSTYRVAHNCLLLQFQRTQEPLWLLWVSGMQVMCKVIKVKSKHN